MLYIIRENVDTGCISYEAVDAKDLYEIPLHIFNEGHHKVFITDNEETYNNRIKEFEENTLILEKGIFNYLQYKCDNNRTSLGYPRINL